MPTSPEERRFPRRSATAFHPISADDWTAMAAMRAAVQGHLLRVRFQTVRVSQNGTLATSAHLLMPKCLRASSARFSSDLVDPFAAWTASCHSPKLRPNPCHYAATRT